MLQNMHKNNNVLALLSNSCYCDLTSSQVQSHAPPISQVSFAKITTDGKAPFTFKRLQDATSPATYLKDRLTAQGSYIGSDLLYDPMPPHLLVREELIRRDFIAHIHRAVVAAIELSQRRWVSTYSVRIVPHFAQSRLPILMP